MNSVQSKTSRIISLAQAVLLLLTPAMPVMAAEDAAALSFADLGALGDCEKSLFGAEHKNLPSAKRVEALENQVFGETKKGSLTNRVAALKSAMAASKSNLLMPPMAAKMDTPPPVKPAAPSQSYAQKDDDDDMPPTAPKSDPAKNMLHQAMSLYSQGKVQDAETAFKKVLSVDKHNADAYYNLGAIAEGRADYSGALHYYQSALKENPADSDTQSAVTAMQAKVGGGGSVGGTPMASQPPSSAPVNRDALRAQVTQASAAYKRGDFDQAISLLQGVARQAPQEADVQFALSQAYKGKQQYMDARSALNQAIAISPDNQMYKDALRDLDRQMTSGGPRGSGSGSPQGYDTIASNSGSGPTDANGGVLPFSNTSSNGWQPMGNTTAAYTPNSSYYPGMDHGGTSSRIKRAAIRGATGAAVGMAFGSMFGGYNRRGSMMTGAAIGGLFGILRGF